MDQYFINYKTMFPLLHVNHPTRVNFLTLLSGHLLNKNLPLESALLVIPE